MYIQYVLFSHILLEVVWKVCFNSSVQVICTVCHTVATQTVNGIKIRLFLTSTCTTLSGERSLIVYSI
ncbi:MAG: hypothetical protein ACI8RD_007576 [Bacillariaceae sp.]|jgi:hypothetical protein